MRTCIFLRFFLSFFPLFFSYSYLSTDWKARSAACLFTIRHTIPNVLGLIARVTSSHLFFPARRCPVRGSSDLIIWPKVFNFEGFEFPFVSIEPTFYLNGFKWRREGRGTIIERSIRIQGESIKRAEIERKIYEAFFFSFLYKTLYLDVSRRAFSRCEPCYISRSDKYDLTGLL